ncbi:MAG: hypothetical protein ACI9H6_000348 [Patiriisocius sp.]|jgi:hypothetical protein
MNFTEFNPNERGKFPVNAVPLRWTERKNKPTYSFSGTANAIKVCETLMYDSNVSATCIESQYLAHNHDCTSVYVKTNLKLSHGDLNKMIIISVFGITGSHPTLQGGTFEYSRNGGYYKGTFIERHGSLTLSKEGAVRIIANMDVELTIPENKPSTVTALEAHRQKEASAS